MGHAKIGDLAPVNADLQSREGLGHDKQDRGQLKKGMELWGRPREKKKKRQPTPRMPKEHTGQAIKEDANYSKRKRSNPGTKQGCVCSGAERVGRGWLAVLPSNAGQTLGKKKGSN